MSIHASDVGIETMVEAMARIFPDKPFADALRDLDRSGVRLVAHINVVGGFHGFSDGRRDLSESEVSGQLSRWRHT